MNSIPFPSRTIHNNPIERCVMHRKKCNISSLVVRRSPIDASRRKCNLCRPLAREIKIQLFFNSTNKATNSINCCLLLEKIVTEKSDYAEDDSVAVRRCPQQRTFLQIHRSNKVYVGIRYRYTLSLHYAAIGCVVGSAALPVSILVR